MSDVTNKQTKIKQWFHSPLFKIYLKSKMFFIVSSIWHFEENHPTILIVRDFIQTGCGIHMTDQRATHVSKALAILFGIIGYAFIFVVKNVGGVLEVL